MRLTKAFVLGLTLFTVLGASADEHRVTVVNDETAKTMLLGEHKLSLQWISWTHLGLATVTDQDGVLHLRGEQKGRSGGDFVRIDGVVKEINAKHFVFHGTVVTQVSHINKGKPCTRSGELTFKVTGKRKYWRMQGFDSPCDEAADYVDLYFR